MFLAFFFSFFGGHFFYLGQYWKGVLLSMIILVILPIIMAVSKFVWIWPLGNLILAGYFTFKFYRMTDEQFDLLYNYNPPYEFCQGCGKRLHWANKPMFGFGKLTDDKQICFKCYKIILDAVPGMLKKSDHAYSADDAIAFIRKHYEQKSAIKGAIQEPHFELTPQYFALLKELSEEIVNICHKICKDVSLNNEVKSILPETDTKVFFPGCMIYDMGQIAKMFSGGQLKERNLETTGFVLLSNYILPSPEVSFYLDDYTKIARLHNNGSHRNHIRDLSNVINTGNPVNIQIIRNHDDEPGVQPTVKNLLSLPLWLKVAESPHFDEYAKVLYQYANVITKADGVVTATEVIRLKKLYQLIHNPLNDDMSCKAIMSETKENSTIKTVIEELNSLIGLDGVKKEISSLINLIRIRKAREKEGLKNPPMSFHLVFTGNPGTGKTTVARIVAGIYKHLGILSKGHLVETDRAGLIAGYAGQTSIKVNKVVDSALDGILFIDEAYSLVGENKDDFGREAVATLIKRMEDNRDRLVLIVAGYSGEMKKFIETNPGFKSRFNKYFEFTDYLPAEMKEIFISQCKKLDFTLSPDAGQQLDLILNRAYLQRDKSFGNGRFVRNIFEKTLEKQANRIAGSEKLTRELLTTITIDDIPEM